MSATIETNQPTLGLGACHYADNHVHWGIPFSVNPLITAGVSYQVSTKRYDVKTHLQEDVYNVIDFSNIPNVDHEFAQSALTLLQIGIIDECDLNKLLIIYESCQDQREVPTLLEMFTFATGLDDAEVINATGDLFAGLATNIFRLEDSQSIIQLIDDLAASARSSDKDVSPALINLVRMYRKTRTGITEMMIHIVEENPELDVNGIIIDIDIEEERLIELCHGYEVGSPEHRMLLAKLEAKLNIANQSDPILKQVRSLTEGLLNQYQEMLAQFANLLGERFSKSGPSLSEIFVQVLLEMNSGKGFMHQYGILPGNARRQNRLGDMHRDGDGTVRVILSDTSGGRTYNGNSRVPLDDVATTEVPTIELITGETVTWRLDTCPFFVDGWIRRLSPNAK